MAKFVHLHNHSEFSLLDGLCKISDLVQASVSAGMPALALTDHGNLFGAIEFYKKATEAKIKPIIGMEAYVAKNPIESENGSGQKRDYNHFILLVKNMEGYKNLIKLASLAYEKGFYYKPRIDEVMLEQYSGGLLATSACIKGVIPELLLNNKRSEAEDKARKYRDIFDGDFFIEIMDHGSDEEIIAKERLIELAHDMDIPLVATNDCHYIKPEHYDAQEVKLCIQTQTTMSDPNRFKISTHELFFKSKDEMTSVFKDIPEAIENTVKIAEKCNFEFEFGKIHLPHYPLPKGEDSNEHLRKLSEEGMKERFGKETSEIRERLDHELHVIKETGFADYFLIVQDFINWAKERGIAVGPGRGSAAGSIVSYVLNITDVDPLKYGLLFERFLNPERNEPPDFDIDFADDRRDEVIGYLREKYGEGHVAQIITFGTMAARAAIRDAGRALGLPYALCDRVAKLVPFIANQGYQTLTKYVEKTPELQNLYNADPEVKKLIDVASHLDGVARHASVHAAGVV
ncbi:DNA polymerase III subunit alpha, partial [candidate division KSB1 bacterium]|nr:DNA polymerase III subunit alpha [candidate division KSB1 bacterium]